MATSTTNSLLATVWSYAGDVVTTNLPLILGIAVGVFAVIFLFRIGKRLIAGR